MDPQLSLDFGTGVENVASVTVADGNGFEYTFQGAIESIPVENQFEIISEVNGSTTHHGSICVVSASDCIPSHDGLALSGDVNHGTVIAIPSISIIDGHFGNDKLLMIEQPVAVAAPKPKIERRKRPIPSLWKRNRNKLKRMKGEAYMGYQTVPADGKQGVKFTEAQPRTSRTLGPPCTKHFSTSKKGYQCHLVSEEERQVLFNNFWNNMDWGQKKLYVCLHVEVDVPKRKTTSAEESRRGGTLRYFIRRNSVETVRVCKLMFLSTFGIGTGMVRHWITNSCVAPKSAVTIKDSSQCGKSAVVAKVSEDDYVYEFLASLPTVGTNTAKVSSSKVYLEPSFSSKKQVFSLYQERCKETNIKPVSRAAFQELFDKYNLSVIPKYEACDICTLYKTGRLDDEVGRYHLNNEDRARKERELDKAIKTKAHVLIIAVSPVRQTPLVKGNLPANLLLKSRLNVYGVTIFELKSDTVTCMWWNESNGELNPSTYASCIVHFMETKCADDLPVIIYSDGDVHFNRNEIFTNALLHYSNKFDKPVTQKYFEKGHTRSECDDVHRNIEKALKNMDIHLPSDYERAYKFARKKPSPYQTLCMTYDCFRDFSHPELQRYTVVNFTTAMTDGDAEPRSPEKLRAIRYYPDGSMSYKKCFVDGWSPYPELPKHVPDDQEYPMLYTRPCKLSEEKWRDLQALKSLLPSDCVSFYDFLPFEASCSVQS